MPTSTLAEDCGSKELNLQAGSQKKTVIQDKNFKKLQVSLKATNDLDNGCMSPVVDSAHVLLKPAENGQMFSGHFEYDHPQKHGQRPYGQPNEHVNEYAASYAPSQVGNKMDSYVDLSQCEKDNQRNMQYGHQQVNYAEHPPNVQTVTGQERYNGNNIQTRSHNNNHCPVSMESCAPQNHKQNVCRKSSKRCCSRLTCFIVAILVIQVIWMGLFAWLLMDKMNLSDRDEEHAVANKDHKSHHSDDFKEITIPPVKYQDPHHHYPTPAPPMAKGPFPAVPTLGIKMEIDPSFLSSQGNTVMWTYPDERHLTGIEYHNGYFRVNVTGFYFAQSTLSLDHRPNNDKEHDNIRFNHCIKVDGRPKMDVCENKELRPTKSGGSTVQDPMMYLESGSSVYVSISHMTKIYDSVTENKFVMFLQRIA